MIIVEMSSEFLIDIFTEGLLPYARCTKGLPNGNQLVLHDITYNSTTSKVEMHFDDGKEETTYVTLAFNTPNIQQLLKDVEKVLLQVVR